MLILVIHQNNLNINYKIFQAFKKKYSLQRYGHISWDENNLLWNKFSSQGKMVAQSTLPIPENNLNFEEIISHQFLNKHEYDIVVHKFSCGGNEFAKITRLTPQTLEKIEILNHLAPKEQPADVALARSLLAHYPKAKHYACFDSSFHQTLNPSSQLLYGDGFILKNYGCHGLEFSAISQKLNQLSDKKLAKKCWIIVYLDEKESTLCGIKNHRSLTCSSSYLHQNLPSINHNGAYDPVLALATPLQNESTKQPTISSITEALNSEKPELQQFAEFYTSAIANNIAATANDIGGIDGIVFCGTLGSSLPQLRQKIIDKIFWLGCEIGNKANLENQCKLHKKTSTTQIFMLKTDIESAVLAQLMERL